MTEELKPRIVVFGVGGAGGNAVDNMIEANLQGVEFVVANTDAQALNRSQTSNRIQLGPQTTGGLGAGARPGVGASAAEESVEAVESFLEGAHMVFIAAGMGGGTGTGAAPIIARTAHEKGILTVGVVTKPFGFEGTRRMKIAEDGLVEMRKNVDTLIVVPNQNLFRVANERTTFADAFRMADDVLYSGVRGITDLMVMEGLINLDFADVRSIMTGMGTAMMGMGEAEGENRALEAARAAIDNPLLDDVTMRGAKGVLINITGGYDMTLFELDEAANEIRNQVDEDANIILGSTFDADLEGRLRVSVVAAGLDSNPVAMESRLGMPVVSPADDAPETDAPDEAPAVIVTGAGEAVVDTEPEPEEAPDAPVPASEAEADPRADFAGRPLPAAHVEAMDGDDAAPASDLIAGQRRGDRIKDTSEAGGFSALFNWRKSPGENDDHPEPDTDPEYTPEPAARTDEAAPAPFDDEDLEIPAFLRRSANH